MVVDGHRSLNTTVLTGNVRRGLLAIENLPRRFVARENEACLGNIFQACLNDVPSPADFG